MISHVLVRYFPHHRLLRTSQVRFTFDALEKAYLIHWSMGVETIFAVSMGIGISFVFLLLLGEEA